MIENTVTLDDIHTECFLCVCALQPTGRSGVSAFPPGRSAQRGQQGHRQAKRHCGGLRPPAVSNQHDRWCVHIPVLTPFYTGLQSGSEDLLYLKRQNADIIQLNL